MRDETEGLVNGTGNTLKIAPKTMSQSVERVEETIEIAPETNPNNKDGSVGDDDIYMDDSWNLLMDEIGSDLRGSRSSQSTVTRSVANPREQSDNRAQETPPTSTQVSASPSTRNEGTPVWVLVGIISIMLCSVAVIGVVLGAGGFGQRLSSGSDAVATASGTASGKTDGDTKTGESSSKGDKDGKSSKSGDGKEADEKDEEKKEEEEKKEDEEKKEESKQEEKSDGDKPEASSTKDDSTAPSPSSLSSADTSQSGQATVRQAVESKPQDLGNCTIIFDANGGSCGQRTKEVHNGDSLGSLPTPSQDYYTFNGWFFGDTVVTSSTVLPSASNHTLTAHWRENSVSGWVRASETPSGAQVIDRKWTYKQTTYKQIASSYTYFRYCSNYDGMWQQDSCWINSTSCYHEITVQSPITACPNKFPDQGGNAGGLCGPYGSCSHKREGQSYWWLKQVNYTNVVDHVDSRESSSKPSGNNISDVTEWVTYRAR